MKLLKILPILFLLPLFGQQNTTIPQSKSIENEFKIIYNTGRKWNEYKMIKKEKFLSFEKRVLDSVRILKNNAKIKDSTIKQQTEKINELSNNINSLNKKLNESIESKDSMSLLGLNVNKGIYNTVLWLIIITLITVLTFFIYKFKNSNHITKKTKENFIELEQEHENYRKKSLEREQKLRRKLQDEINKQRGV